MNSKKVDFSVSKIFTLKPRYSANQWTEANSHYKRVRTTKRVLKKKKRESIYEHLF